MSFAGVSFIFRGRSRADSAATTVVADPIDGRIVDDRLVVSVMNDRGVYVHHRSVIEEIASLPVSTLVGGVRKAAVRA